MLPRKVEGRSWPGGGRGGPRCSYQGGRRTLEGKEGLSVQSSHLLPCITQRLSTPGSVEPREAHPEALPLDFETSQALRHHIALGRSPSSGALPAVWSLE